MDGLEKHYDDAVDELFGDHDLPEAVRREVGTAADLASAGRDREEYDDTDAVLDRRNPRDG